ncbi:MAG: zinc-binding dehydrogenase [Acidimicrobiales bacterium]
MAETMRAGQMHGVNDMRCVEAPVPTIDDGQILVRTTMASICGSDLHVVCHGAGVGFPMPCPHGYPGHEGIGEVVDSRAEGIEPGTRVLCFPFAGSSEGFSEYQRMKGRYVLPLPQSPVPEQELLMAQQFGTVIFAARQRPVDVVGRTVVVLGQGSAGLFWTYWLKRSGAARLIAVDLSDARLAVASSFGADVTVNAGEVDVADAVRQSTGAGADYVVEAVGRRETLYQSIELVRPGGDLLWFGLPDTDDSVPISFAQFFRKKLTASCTFGAQDEGDAVSFRTALDLISGGHIDVSPLLSHVYPVEEIAAAFEVANDPVPAGALKVSVTF